MNTEAMVLDIKKELRASMNGILSRRMREAGLPFKLIFGVELPRLQSIAGEFPRGAELSGKLWNQDIRETRLLAIMLMPPEAFTPDVANAWAEAMVSAEEAQIMAMKLMPHAPHAKTTSMAWLERDKPLPCVCACLCLRHLLVRGSAIGSEERHRIEENLKKLLPKANLHLRKAIRALEEKMKDEKINK